VLAVLKKEPKNAYANMLMAMLYARNPQTHSLARGYYKEFLRLAPEDPLAAQAHEWLRSH
jgi:Tfp pilus assembly protein PilF